MRVALFWSNLFSGAERGPASRKYRAERPSGVATTDFHQFAMGAGHQYDCLKSDTLSDERQQGWAWRTRDIPVDMTKFVALLNHTRQESADRIKFVIKS